MALPPPPPPQMQLRFTLRTGCGGGLCTPHHGAGTRRATPHQVTMPPSHCAAASPHQNHTATQAASVAPRRTKLHRQALLGLSAVPRYCGGAAAAQQCGARENARRSAILERCQNYYAFSKVWNSTGTACTAARRWRGAWLVLSHRARRHQAAL